MPADERPSADPFDGVADFIDRAAGAGLAKASAGISPVSFALAYGDWALHLAMSPGKRTQLAAKAARMAVCFARYAAGALADPARAEPCITPLPQDRRFRDPAWQALSRCCVPTICSGRG